MPPIVLEARVKNLIQTEADWLAEDPVILEGEIAYVKFGNFVNTKAGDGVKKFSQLQYNLEKPAQPIGVLKPTDVPGPANAPRFWFAEKGVYPNVGLTVTGNAGIIIDNGSSFQVANFEIDLVDYQKTSTLNEKWSFVKFTSNASAEVVESSASLRGYIKTTGQILVVNPKGGFYRLNAINQPLDDDIFYLSSTPDNFTPLNANTIDDLGEVYVLTAGRGSIDISDKIVLGTNLSNGYGWSSIYDTFSKSANDYDFFIAPSDLADLSVVANPDRSVTFYVTNRIPVFMKKANTVFFWKVGSYTISEGKQAVFFWNNSGVGSFSFNNQVPNVTDIELVQVGAFEYDKQNMSTLVGINWNGNFYTSHEVLKVKSQSIDFSKYVPSSEIKDLLRTFFHKLDTLTNSDQPLEVLEVGDSISNYQHAGPVKSNRTVEPQCLYGNTFLRWIWRRLNFTYNDRDIDSVAANFPDAKAQEWGNLRFLRADHPDVVKSSEFIPSGTRESDNALIYWGQRTNINGLTTCLGGFRLPTPEAGTIATSIGSVKLHNHVYFFNNVDNAYIEFTLPANAKGFSPVFWGDDYQAAFPRINGGTWEYLSFDLEVKVDGVIVDNINMTDHRGQTRLNYVLTNTGAAFKVRITNKSASRTMNLWGLEYWLGKCVRVSNYAAAGNQASSFYNNPTYMLDKPADLIIWQTTTLNNVGGFSQVSEHKALGNLLKMKNVPIVATTCHPVVEGSVTNFPENTAKVFQHVDAYASAKALYELGIPFIDAFSAFKEIAIPLKYAGSYQNYFIDEGHLSDKGEAIYSALFDHVFSWK